MALLTSWRSYYGLALLALLVTIWVRGTPEPPAPPAPPLLRGRNNTVLIVTSEQAGLANVHLATALSLLEHHPSVNVHYASFPRLATRVQRISDAGRSRNPRTKPIASHTLPGPDVQDAFYRTFGGPNGIIELPGVKGMGKKLTDLGVLFAAWPQEEHWGIHEAMLRVVDEVDPSLVVVDHILKPAAELAGSVPRRFLTISPNALADLVPDRQPWGGMFWKYPAIASGYPFPLPWHLIPANVYIQVRIILGLLTIPNLNAKRAYLAERGVKDPLAFASYPPGMRLLAMTLPEASLPMDSVPAEISFHGPIVLETEAQDEELMGWLAEGRGDAETRTVLVNLGSLVRFREDQARHMAGALALVLAQVEGVRFLWKFRKEGEYDEEEALAPLRRSREAGRVRVVEWLDVDPTTVLMSGDIDLFVNHGGGNSYHEAVYAGVPQVLLPLWFDCYNIASTAEYLGIGLWPGKETAPEWEAEAVAEGIVRALVGKESAGLREKSRALGEVARGYGGRESAAREIARLAGGGDW